MTTEVLSGGVASAALLGHAVSVGDYLGEISLGLLSKLSDSNLLAEVLGIGVTPTLCLLDRVSPCLVRAFSVLNGCCRTPDLGSWV